MNSHSYDLDDEETEQPIEDQDRRSCLERMKRSKFFLPLFNYEYSKDIRRFPIGFKDPFLKQKYEEYQNDKLFERLLYLLLWVIPYSILLLITMFFGSKDLIPIKLGRLIINWAGLIAGATLSQKRK